jgi:hypothetical protein
VENPQVKGMIRYPLVRAEKPICRLITRRSEVQILRPPPRKRTSGRVPPKAVPVPRVRFSTLSTVALVQSR